MYCSDSFEITDKYFSVLRNSVATESIEEPISENITAGTYFVDSYVLGGKKLPMYKFIQTVLSDEEGDSQIKNTLLKSIDESCRNFQVKEDGGSYIQ